MTEYDARVEYDMRKITKSVDERLIESLRVYHPATSRTAQGRVEARFTLPAESLREAGRTALALAQSALDVPVLAIDLRVASYEQ